MKKNQHLKNHQLGPVEAKGFALIASISIMSLIVLIALALLSLSTITTRTASHSRHIAIAKANARLALTEALARLQSSLGPDQRVSAEADIFDGSSLANTSNVTTHASKKHLVAAFNTEDWHSRDVNGMPNNYLTYNKSRNDDAFERYLISGSEADVTDIEYAETAMSSSDSIVLIGEGTHGSTATEDIVRAPLQTVGTTGTYAWVVGDEGVKASYSLHDERDITSTLANKYRQMNPEQTNLAMMTDFSGLVFDSTAFKTDLNKVITRKTMELHGEDNASAAIALKIRENYHDLTWASESVLASTTRPGLKRDLSLAFELPDYPPMWIYTGVLRRSYSLMTTDDYNAYHTFVVPRTKDNGGATTINREARPSTYDELWELNNSGDISSSFNHGRMYFAGSNHEAHPWWNTKVGYVYSVPKPGSSSGTDKMGNSLYLRGPSWRILRNHYRMYKRELEQMPIAKHQRRNVPNPTDSRTYLARPYQGPSFHADSNGWTGLSEVYGGDSFLYSNGGDVYQSPSHWNPFYNYGFASSRGDHPWNNRNYASYGLTPIITKVGVVLSIYRDAADPNRFRVCMDSVGTVWNPYNVAVECSSVFHALDFNGVKWDLERDRGGAITQVALDLETLTTGTDKYFPFRYNRIGVSSDGTVNPSTNWRLNPGEIRTFTMSTASTAPTGYSWASLTAQPCQFNNNWQGGQFLVTGDWGYVAGDRLTFKFRPSSEAVRLRSFLGYFRNINGGYINPFDTEANGTAYEELPELSTVNILDGSNAFTAFDVPVTSVPLGYANKQAVAYFEFTRETSDTAADSMGQDIDPRAIVTGAKGVEDSNSDAQSIPRGWVLKAERINDFTQVQAGVGARNSGFFGTSHSGSGEDNVVLFDIPDSPVTNIGMLQGAQIAPTAYDVPNAIGGSAKHLRLAKNEVIRENTVTALDIGGLKTNETTGSSHPTSDSFTNVWADSAYLVNSGLWDNYFFSGIELPYGTTYNNAMTNAETIMKSFMQRTDSGGNPNPSPLLNRRLRYQPSGTSAMEADYSYSGAASETLKQLTHYRWMARNMMLMGGFNINSTRVEAWKAVLSSMRDKDVATVNPADGTLGTDGGTGTAFTRMLNSAGNEGDEWLGYTRLTDAEIGTLAEKMVEEVRTRGPFLSVADFVNRRLSTDATGDNGAIQAALEAAVPSKTGSGNEKGITGSIKQNDILANIGGVITARSDTFVIRAYGDSRDNNGNIIARAYVEAVVQRTPLLVDDNGQLIDAQSPGYHNGVIGGKQPAHTDPYSVNPNAPDAARPIDSSDVDAKGLGRRFIIKQIKWLKEEEV